MAVVLELDRRQVLAHRIRGHGLDVRRPATDLVAAAGVAGMRRTKGCALAFAARVDGVTAHSVTEALDDRRLVALWSARGNVVVVPSADAAVFTAGLAPSTDLSRRAWLTGPIVADLDAAGMTVTDALAAVAAAIQAALAEGPLSTGELAGAVTRTVPTLLVGPCQGRCPDPHVNDSLYRLVAACGGMRFDGSGEYLAAADQLADLVHGRPTSREDLRTEFLRRYLRCYGPSKPAALAEWAGLSRAETRERLTALSAELVETSVGGRKAGLMLTADAESAASAEPVSGIRFLPPYDAFLLDRDRAMLLPERAHQRTVWKSIGNPGVVLVDGELVATWRGRPGRSQPGRGRYTITVEPFGPNLPVADGNLRDEARRLAPAVADGIDVEVRVRRPAPTT